jgi:RNA 2',3'-cyclic 3'-phosphodiesterase
MRLFVAADVDDAARAACAGVAERLRAKGFAGKWVPPENYHLTVAFLGGVDAERTGDVAAAVRRAAMRLALLEVPLDAVGAFPSERRARVAWVGPSARLPAFGTLCGVVRSELAALGFEFDAHADAHVTLARSEGRAALPSVAPPHLAPVRIDALTLYRSITAPSGARYEPLERFRLGAVRA